MDTGPAALAMEADDDHGAAAAAGGDDRERAPRQARGGPKAWVATAQPARRKKATCRHCRSAFEAGQLRLTPRRYQSTGSWMYHWHCIVGGIARQDTLDAAALDAEQRHELEALPRSEGAALAAPPPAPAALGDRGHEAENDTGEVDFSANVLRHMEWWDAVDWAAALKVEVATWDAVPEEVRDAAAEAREAVLEQYIEGASATDCARAWRLSQFMDRLLFWRVARPGGANRGETVIARLKLFWRGAWDELWAAAHPGPETHGGAARRAAPSLAQRAARIESFVEAGELGKAARVVHEKLPLVSSLARLGDVTALFPVAPRPADVIPAGAAAGMQAPDVDWEAVRAALAKTVDTAPRHVAPGRSGSRYEHWQPPKGCDRLRDLTVEAMLKWLRGEAPAEAYAAERGSRLLAFDKGAGKLRTVLVGGAFRRLALAGFLKAHQSLAVAAVGKSQFALGKHGGAEALYQLLRCHSEADMEAIIAAADLSNAFGRVSRGKAVESLTRRCPWAAPIFALLYEGTSEHVWATDAGPRTVVAECGFDPGCPLSVLAFLSVMADITDETQAAIDANPLAGPRDAIKGYMDDVYLAVKREILGSTLAAFATAAAARNLPLNEDKTQIWSVTGSMHGLNAAQQARVVQTMRILGHHADSREGGPAMPVFGDAAAGFGTAVAEFRQFLHAMDELMAAGLSKQAAQALVRLRAATATQHITRGIALQPDQVAEHDSQLDRWWARLAGAELNSMQMAQMDLPFQMGGCAIGKLGHRCLAAFLSGSLQALPTVMAHFGADTPTSLRALCPRLIQEMEQASEALKDAGVKDDLGRWRRGQPQGKKGLQSRWVRQIQEGVKAELLQDAPTAQQLAIRSGGGTGAASFLRAPTSPAHRVDDASFTESLRARVAAPTQVTRADGSTMQCQHRPLHGASSCNVELDANGHHARTCPTGGYVTSTHNGVRDILHRRWTADLGVVCLREQRTPQFDYYDDDGRLVRAIMDLVPRIDGQRWHCDVTVVDPDSTDQALRRQRSARDGHAAANAEDRKRRRYGSGVVPLAWETGGRVGEAGLMFLRRLYAGAAPQLLPALLQEVGCAIAAGTAAAAIAARTP